MGARTKAEGTRTDALLKRARINLISRTARVYSRLGQFLSRDLNIIVQWWITQVLKEAESDIASGEVLSVPELPASAERTIREVMVHALAQGYWLQHVYMQECRAAAQGQRYRGRVTLADDTELDDEEIRRLLESLMKSAKVGADPAWHAVIPTDAVKWIEGYTPKLAGVLEKDIFEKVRGVVRESMFTGSTLKQRMEALREADPKIRAMGKHRVEAIARTEVTRADSMGRLIDMKSNPDVLGVEFSAILDDRTTDMCQARHGLVMRMDDPRLPYNTPPIHVRCRSLLLAATVYEHPDGLLTSHEFDDIEPGTQRPEDIEAVREVLGSVEGTPSAPKVEPSMDVIPKREPFIPSPELGDISPAPDYLDEVKYHQSIAKKQDGITDDDLRLLEEKFKELLASDSTRLGNRCKVEVLEDVLEGGRMKSLFETGTSGGAKDPLYRAEAELIQMAYPEDSSPKNRPIYGMLFDAADLSQLKPSDWCGRNYGSVVVVFKHETKRYATFTVGDSLNSYAQKLVAPSPMLAPSVDSVPSHIWRFVLEDIHQGTALSVKSVSSQPFVSNAYIEAQIHKNRATIDQIEAVIFGKDIPDEKIPRELLRKRGIPWRKED